MLAKLSETVLMHAGSRKGNLHPDAFSFLSATADRLVQLCQLKHMATAEECKALFEQFLMFKNLVKELGIQPDASLYTDIHQLLDSALFGHQSDDQIARNRIEERIQEAVFSLAVILGKSNRILRSIFDKVANPAGNSLQYIQELNDLTEELRHLTGSNGSLPQGHSPSFDQVEHNSPQTVSAEVQSISAFSSWVERVFLFLADLLVSVRHDVQLAYIQELTTMLTLHSESIRECAIPRLESVPDPLAATLERLAKTTAVFQKLAQQKELPHTQGDTQVATPLNSTGDALSKEAFSQAANPAILEIFRDECQMHIGHLQQNFKELQTLHIAENPDISQFTEIFLAMLRTAHTLKGAASMAGLPSLAIILHALEEILVRHAHHPSLPSTADLVFLEKLVLIIGPLAASFQQITTLSSIAIAPARHTGSIPVGLDEIASLLTLEGRLRASAAQLTTQLEKSSSLSDELSLLSQRVAALHRLQSSDQIQLPPAQSHQPDDDSNSVVSDTASGPDQTSREIAEIFCDIKLLQDMLANSFSALSTHSKNYSNVLELLQNQLLQLKTASFSSFVGLLQQTVDNLSKELGKEAQLNIVGQDLQLDRSAWTQIIDAMLHILRNSLDHGVEAPAARMAANKNRQAVVQIEARQHGNQAIFRISDDGAGIDTSLLRQRLHQFGLVKPYEILSDEQLLRFIFHPGFSTRETVSQTSGRGLGLSIVKQNIENLGGKLHVENTHGKGCLLEIAMPLSFMKAQAIFIRAGSSLSAIPVTDILEVATIDTRDLAQQGMVFRWRNQSLAIRFLASLLGIAHAQYRTDPLHTSFPVLIVNEGTALFAVVVDEVLPAREISIQPFHDLLSHLNSIAGFTLLDETQLVPVLNLPRILMGAPANLIRSPVPAEQRAEEKSLRILIADDSLAVRTTISDICSDLGWQYKTAVDGVQALYVMEQFHPDIVFIDADLPAVDGRDLMTVASTQPSWQRTVFVHMTFAANPFVSSLADLSKQSHQQLLLIKPFDREQVINIVCSLKNIHTSSR